MKTRYQILSQGLAQTGNSMSKSKGGPLDIRLAHAPNVQHHYTATPSRNLHVPRMSTPNPGATLLSSESDSSSGRRVRRPSRVLETLDNNKREYMRFVKPSVTCVFTNKSAFELKTEVRRILCTSNLAGLSRFRKKLHLQDVVPPSLEISPDSRPGLLDVEVCSQPCRRQVADIFLKMTLGDIQVGGSSLSGMPLSFAVCH